MVATHKHTKLKHMLRPRWRRARLWGFELAYLSDSSCWNYLFFERKGLIKVHHAPSGTSEIGVARGWHRATEDTGFWFSNTKGTVSNTYSGTHTHTHSCIQTHCTLWYWLITQAVCTVFLCSCLKGVFMLGLQFSGECPVWACVLIISWSAGFVTQRNSYDQEATGKVGWEQITVGRRRKEWEKNLRPEIEKSSKKKEEENETWTKTLFSLETK